MSERALNGYNTVKFTSTPGQSCFDLLVNQLTP